MTSLVDVLKAIESFVLKLETSTQNKERSSLMRLLIRENKTLYRIANREKEEKIIGLSQKISAQIIVIERLVSDPSRFKVNCGMIHTLASQGIEYLEQRLGNPHEGTTWLIDGLAVLTAAYNLCLQENSLRVAAMIVTSKGGEYKRVFGTNSGKDDSPYHAEISAITQALNQGLNLSGAYLYISSAPCFEELTLELKEDEAGKIQGEVVKSSKNSSVGRTIWWKVEPRKGNERLATCMMYNMNYKFQIKEIFLTKERSIVYYCYDQYWIPREIRFYSEQNGRKFLSILEGCAVTISLLKFSEVFYLTTNYPNAITFLDKSGVETHLIENDSLQRIAGLIGNGQGSFNQIQGEMKKLESRLHMDVMEVISKRYNIHWVFDQKEFKQVG